MEENMFLTLAGYLEYLQKPGIGFGRQRFKKYWFMFDENTCSLNYYVDRDALMNTLEPIGKIDMTNVTVSPSGEAGHTNEFEINCGDKRTHRFKVTDWKEANDWIRKLEHKREGWCKSAVKRQTNKPQRVNKTLSGVKPYTSTMPVMRTTSLNLPHLSEPNSGGLIEMEYQDNEVVTDTPPTGVKEIFMGTLRNEKSGLLFRSTSSDNGVDTERPKSAELFQSDTVNGLDYYGSYGKLFDLYAQWDIVWLFLIGALFIVISFNELDKWIRQMFFRGCEETDNPPNPPQRSQSLFAKAMSDPSMLEHIDDNDECFDENTVEASPSRQVNYKRRMWMLEEKCLTAQKDIATQTRKNIDMKKELKKSQAEVEELRKEVTELRKLKELSNLPEAQLRSKVTELQDLVTSYEEQKKLLLDDLKMRMNQHQEYENAIQQERRKYTQLQQEMFKFKAKFVKLLGNTIKIKSAFAEQIFVDPEEEEAKKNLLELLRTESGDSFPFNGKTFEDQYGDIHDWATGNEVQHFLCNNLYLHFTTPEKEKHEKAWGEFMMVAKRNYSEAFEKSDRELRTLLRHGVPFDLRSKIWTILVNKQMGRIRDLKDQSAPPNGYYQSLVGKSQNSPDLKQIMVDLDRTLPQNKHFRRENGGQGLSHMKNILLAYSIHNPNLGYCQGMNMLVAVGLLFLDEETTFWLLVLIIEKMTPKDYYTPGLLGAQADQALMRELVAEKIPQLNSHLQTCGVDIAMITFNWLLAAFVDALPTESMLRIWDCFLYEGRKVLYRFALSILKLYEKKILQMSDTNNILGYLKKLPKHIFNMEDLFYVAFTGFEPFPSRNALMRRHEAHMQKVEATFKEGEKLRAAMQLETQKKETKKNLIKSRTLSSALLSETITATRKPPIWECGCVITDDEIWLGCGERQGAKVCVINCEEEKLKLDVPLAEFSSRLCCMKTVRKDMVVFGTLDFTIHAVNSITKKEIWNIKVKDSVLDVVGSDDDINLFAGLADGTVAIILATDYDPPPASPLLIRIGTEPVNCMVLTSNNELWCGSGSSVSIISSRTLEPLKSLSGAERRPLYKMAIGSHGVWMSYRSSPLITLYHVTHHIRLLEIDYTSSFNLNPSDNSIPDSQVNLDQRITSILPYGNFLWVGTGGGCVCVFLLQPNCSNVDAKLNMLVAKETAKDQSFFEQSVFYQHGLIGVEESTTKDDEKQRNRYQRRKEFGRTFHTRFTSSGKKYEEDADVYKLEFVASHTLTSEHADAVRVMIPLSYKSNPYVVTCCRVRKMNDASKSVQLWYCPGNQNPQKWQYQFIDCNTIVMQRQMALSLSGPTVKIKQHELKEDLPSDGNATATQHREPLDEIS